MRVPLWKIAHARSGDKADRADIGLFAYDAPTYAVLKQEVTVQRLAEHFRAICEGPVEVYPLDNILAIKIVLNRALQGGAARSLRMDNLGKNVAAALLRMEIEAPDGLVLIGRTGSKNRLDKQDLPAGRGHRKAGTTSRAMISKLRASSSGEMRPPGFSSATIPSNPSSSRNCASRSITSAAVPNTTFFARMSS